MNNRTIKIIIGLVLLFLVVKSCNSMFRSGSSKSYSSSKVYEKSPVDKLILAMSDDKNFSIILKDMEMKDNRYFHKYKILREKADTVLVDDADWTLVSDVFFKANIDNLGMEIASKKDGKVSKKASPAGYNHYVGNEKYGHWNNSGGSSFWEFYGKYAFMSSMFNMFSPTPRSYWNDYNRRSYGSRSYYGPTGRTAYGTKSYTSAASKKTSSWASKPSSFRNSVRSNVTRSVSSRSSRRYSSGSSYSGSSSSSARRSRSSSRYSGSSSRSRSGGFGK